MRPIRTLLIVLFAYPALSAAAPEVTIYRDNYGVPHIVGDTEEDTFFGYGYAQAEDHLERMMVEYRDAQGRRAEVDGFSALGEGYLQFIEYEYRWDGDYLQRLLRTKQGVVDRRAQMDPAIYRILDAFARGVNSYINEHRTEIPAWIDSVSAEDIEALERSQFFRFYSVHDALLKLLARPYSFPNLGSNQFAISREKSASGRIIHVEHTHMPWANRFQNYEAHLITPGKLNAGGISWFGSPFFLDGFNADITWSATYNEPNIADIYEEKLNPENHLQYQYEGGWKEIRREFATFRIKREGGMDSVTLPMYYTHHGPIVRYEPKRLRAYSVKLPEFESVNYAAHMYAVAKSRNLDEFRSVMARQWLPRWNMLFTDAQDMYWVHNGNVARRADGFDWRKPVPGWTKETEWGPYLPFASYPQILNPPSGFLQNCNNPPWVATRASGLKPLDPVPYYLRSEPKPEAGEEVLNTRGERVFQVLSENRKFTIEDMTALGFDTYIVPADVIVPLLDKAAKADASRVSDPVVMRALEQIRQWNRRSSKESTAYTYVHYWGKAYRDLFGPRRFARFISYERRQLNLDSAEEQRMALDALKEGLRRIQARFGKPEVAWGEINFVVRGGTFPLEGEDMYGVLHPDEGVEQDDGRILCDDGWGHLLIVMEGNPKQVWSLLPYGQSEHPTSPHYNDQAKLHSAGKAKRFWLTPEEILEHTESVWGDRERIKRLLPAQ